MSDDLGKALRSVYGDHRESRLVNPMDTYKRGRYIGICIGVFMTFAAGIGHEMIEHASLHNGWKTLVGDTLIFFYFVVNAYFVEPRRILRKVQSSMDVYQERKK